MNELIKNLQNASLINIDGNIILEKHDNFVHSVDQSTFWVFFGDAKDSPTYEALIGIHTFVWNGESLTKTADELGYKKHFDDWHEKGII